ncbi:MAG: serine/threonine protein kinase, partial [Planctomycetia bacterium]|nr:serine/threonine protein kinase [Planctomycetia bacterium]
RSQVFDEIVHRDPPTPRQVDPELPQELERICMKCLSKRMSDRYPTALELSADLWHWVSQVGKGAESGAARVTTGPGSITLTSADSESGPWRARVRVIPKGLRSFDGSDESFFLALLPGPIDRDGLPESLRFWKTRVDSTDPDEAFPVGLLFGPSGGGKSSLVKAGLIPRLAPHVRPVYIEATPDGTDARLLRGLRKACPDLPEGCGLVDAVRAARESPALRRGKKLLIVIDQFEQWLHACRPGRGASLVEALRHCDGVSVQCLVMARDDFGTAAMRFMNALEVPLAEGKNYALVDRFDAPHAVRVLDLFGRALGRLPEEGPPSADQQRFLDLAVSGMAEEGKVAPVRLAMFAEMFRAKTWETASLRRVGAAGGIGALFLEESLGPTASSPRRRAHQGAARAVLSSLLPAPGVDIKGHMRPYAELLAVSGYGDRPGAFDDLIRLLDGDLRLITPCDPERGNPESAQAPFGVAPAASVVPAAKRSFQLTHDDLVPSLRRWLSRRRSETAAGRAGLLLEDRAAVWAGRPDPRYLPTLPEWVWVGLMTRRADWTDAQARMMRAASRRFAGRLAVAGMLAAAIAVVGLRVAGRLESDRRAAHSAALVAKLWVSQMDHAAGTIDQLESYRPLWHEEVARAADDPRRPVGERTRAHLALARTDPRALPFLHDRL